MAKPKIRTYRNEEGRPLFAVLLSPRNYRVEEDETPVTLWSIDFSFPFFEVSLYPEIEAISNRIVKCLFDKENAGSLLHELGLAIRREESLTEKHIPELFIEKNEISWEKLYAITQNYQGASVWNELVYRLEARLPKPIVINAQHHKYIFSSYRTVLESGVKDGFLQLEPLKGGLQTIFRQVNSDAYDLLLDNYCKSDRYYVPCKLEDISSGYAICDKRKQIKALCLVD